MGSTSDWPTMKAATPARSPVAVIPSCNGVPTGNWSGVVVVSVPLKIGPWPGFGPFCARLGLEREVVREVADLPFVNLSHIVSHDASLRRGL